MHVRTPNYFYFHYQIIKDEARDIQIKFSLDLMLISFALGRENVQKKMRRLRRKKSECGDKRRKYRCYPVTCFEIYYYPVSPSKCLNVLIPYINVLFIPTSKLSFWTPAYFRDIPTGDCAVDIEDVVEF